MSKEQSMKDVRPNKMCMYYYIVKPLIKEILNNGQTLLKVHYSQA